MVVMELLRKEDGWFRASELVKESDWKLLRDAVRAAVGEALGSAHALILDPGESVAHGDCRGDNVMVNLHQLRVERMTSAAAEDASASAAQRGAGRGEAEPEVSGHSVAAACARADLKAEGSATALSSGRSSGPPVRFVDFDWAGVQGVRRYTSFLSAKIAWPEGVAGGQPLQQAHDRAWLSKEYWPATPTMPLSGLEPSSASASSSFGVSTSASSSALESSGTR
jgi:hypothetical protein